MRYTYSFFVRFLHRKPTGRRKFDKLSNWITQFSNKKESETFFDLSFQRNSNQKIFIIASQIRSGTSFTADLLTTLR